MKVLPVIEADLESGPLGLPSRLECSIDVRAVLERVAQRASAIPNDRRGG